MAVSHRELGAQGRGREVAAALRSAHRRAPPRPVRGHGSLEPLRRGALPDAGVARRRVRSALARHRRADGASRAEGQGGGDRRRRPRADAAQPRSDRHRARLSATGRNGMNRRSVLFAPAPLLPGRATAQSPPDNAALVKQVTDTELAFAKTIADRHHAAFASFLADETVFLIGGKPPRGKAAGAHYWKRFYTEPKAPFSWKPDYSTGRREDSGVWRIVFDDGCNFKCA